MRKVLTTAPPHRHINVAQYIDSDHQYMLIRYLNIEDTPTCLELIGKIYVHIYNFVHILF